MTSQNTITVGTPNSGGGNTLYDAFNAVVNNFNQLYGSMSPNPTTLDATFTNNVIITANVTVAQANVNTKLNVGAPAGYTFGSAATEEINGNQNNYVQSVLQNANTGLNASGDFVITSDTGNDTINYVDFGINSSVYNNSQYTVVGAGDGYLFTSNGQLGIGTATANALIFHSNGTLTTNERMRITPGGNVGIGNTAPLHMLSINDSIFCNTQVIIGNTTVNALVNSTTYTGTANNATYLNGVIGSSYITTTGATQIQVGNVTTGTGGVNVTAGQVFLGNTSQNTVITSTSVFVNGVETLNATGMFVGNTTVNALITATTISSANSTGNVQIAPTLVTINSGNLSIVSSVNSTYSIGNSTVNVYSNSTHFFSGNSTIFGFGNSTADVLVSNNGSTAAFVATSTPNSDIWAFGNSTVVFANAAIITSAASNNATLTLSNSTGTATHTPVSISLAGNASSNVSVGNSTINSSINSTSYGTGITGTGTGGALINATTGAASYVLVGNNTVNTYMNTTSVYIGGNTTGQVANGFCYLPNGMKMNWGTFVCNTTSANVVFANAFASHCYSLTVTGQGSLMTGANTPYLNGAPGLANASILSTYAAAATNAYYVAIGI